MRRSIVVVLGSALVAACTATTVDETTTSSAATPQSTTTLTASTTSTIAPTTTTLPLESEPVGLGPLAPRGGHSVVWTGDEVVVWGGEADELGSELFSDGAAFDPETREWRLIAQSPLNPRRYHVAAWTGDEMLIVGGVGATDAAGYDPASDTWRFIESPPIMVSGPAGAGIEGRIGSVWTGEELVVWLVVSDQLAAYDPRSDSWRLLPPTGLDADDGALRWDGHFVYAFGATVLDYPTTNELDTARLVGDAWERLEPTGFSTETYTVGARAPLTAWTGDGFLAWSDSGREARTMFFDTAAGTWSETVDVASPPCDGQGEPISADGMVFAFGWCGPDVGIYDVASRRWTTAPVGGYPTARYTVWTGDQLINWGDTCCYGTGGRPFTTQAWIYEPDS